jgi:hypothetical protein
VFVELDAAAQNVIAGAKRDARLPEEQARTSVAVFVRYGRVVAARDLKNLRRPVR